MEWVETTGRTLDEAKKSALEQLGVAEADADLQVLSEAKFGLFGRLKEEARVRARVQPRHPRSKGERRDRRRRATGDSEHGSATNWGGTSCEQCGGAGRRTARTEGRRSVVSLRQRQLPVRGRGIGWPQAASDISGDARCHTRARRR